MKLEFSVGFHRVPGTQVGLRQFGVPPRGPLDREAARMVGDQLDLESPDEVREVLSTNVETIRCLESGWCCFAGLGHVVEIEGGSSPQMGSRFLVREGEALHFRPVSPGVPTYVGFQQPAAFISAAPRIIELDTSAVIEVFPSPDGLPQENLFQRQFTLTNARDRTGIRLTGECDIPKLSLPSRPVVPGVIQVPSDDTLIVIGPDGPTIGGYPIWGTIRDHDLDRFFRLQSGTLVKFTPAKDPSLNLQQGLKT